MQNLSDGRALTHEKVVGIRIWASNLEELHEVVKLAVNVAAYCDWAFLLQDLSMNDSIRNGHMFFDAIPLAVRWTHPVALLEPRPSLFSLLNPYGFCLYINLLKHTLSHSLCTSFSANCLQFIKLSIHPSSVGIDAGSVAGDRRCGSGNFPMSTSILESIVVWLCDSSVGGGRSRDVDERDSCCCCLKRSRECREVIKNSVAI